MTRNSSLPSSRTASTTSSISYRNCVRPRPAAIDHDHGPYLYDADGNRYLDYVQSWGPVILGHAHPAVVQAVVQASMRGFSFGAPTQAESELAKLVIESVPSIEMVRFVNSG